MKEIIWKFETSNFCVVCREYEPSFIDYLAHEQEIIDAVYNGYAVLTHMDSIVYFRGMKFGSANITECLYVFGDAGHIFGHDRVVAADHSYRRKAARLAISDARKELAEIQGDLPDLYIRKTA